MYLAVLHGAVNPSVLVVHGALKYNNNKINNNIAIVSDIESAREK